MSSDTSWLPLSDRKNIRPIKVIYEEYANQLYGGYYDGSSIVVVVGNPYADLHSEASTIAHEFRHHIQKELNQNKTTIVYQVPEDLLSNYENGIRQYFRNSKSEMDALCYQHRVCPTKTTEYWLKACVLPAVIVKNSDY